MAFWLAAAPAILPTQRQTPTIATVFMWAQVYNNDILICHQSALFQFNSAKQSMPEFDGGSTAGVEKPEEHDRFPVRHTWQEIREIDT